MHLFKILMDLKKIVLVLKYLERKAEGENYHWKEGKLPLEGLKQLDISCNRIEMTAVHEKS